MKDMEAQYPDQWVLMPVIGSDRYGRATRGIVLDHEGHCDKDALIKQTLSLHGSHPRTQTFLSCTGPLIPDGVGVVYHLAAVADVKDVYAEPHYSEAINTRGTINVLEAARLVEMPWVIYGSTTWVYSEAEADVVDEDTALRPPSHLYTATKIASEYYCRAYSNLYGLSTTILRYGIPYGPRARRGTVLQIFVDRALNRLPLTIAGDGQQFRQFVYVEDLAEGNVLAMQEIAKNQVYNLDGKEKITVRQIAETVQKVLGDVEIQYVEGRPGDFAGKETLSHRARIDLGWEPKVSFEEGVRRYIQWYLEAGGKRLQDKQISTAPKS